MVVYKVDIRCDGENCHQHQGEARSRIVHLAEVEQEVIAILKAKGWVIDAYTAFCPKCQIQRKEKDAA